jgi:hypothetical protein
MVGCQPSNHHTLRLSNRLGPQTSAHGAPTVRRHTVSGSISLPSRGTFHHSLTLLFAIGGKEYLALDGGPPRFTQDYSCPALLGRVSEGRSLSSTRLSLSMAQLSSQVRLTIGFVTSRHNLRFWLILPTTLTPQRPYPITRRKFRLFRFRSPLLAESLRFPLLGLLRCFSSPAYPRMPMDSAYGDTPQRVPGSPIRAPPDQFLFPDPRRISLVTAPFVGSLPQGIHHAPFVA